MHTKRKSYNKTERKPTILWKPSSNLSRNPATNRSAFSTHSLRRIVAVFVTICICTVTMEEKTNQLRISHLLLGNTMDLAKPTRLSHCQGTKCEQAYCDSLTEAKIFSDIESSL